MSTTPPIGQPTTDPLEALRSADARPFNERWRDALRERAGWLVPRSRAFLWIGSAAIVALIVARSMFANVDPPVEQSLPVAVERTADTAPPGEISTTAVIGPPVGQVVVHVAGAVRDPGLVQGLATWRVHDAILAAGGALSNADLNRINLAALIADGQRIYVPATDELTIPSVQASAGAAESSGPINLNTADETALQTLPGVGPATAATIVDHRNEHGPFGSVDALVAVRGIGPATLEALREHVTVG